MKGTKVLQRTETDRNLGFLRQGANRMQKQSVKDRLSKKWGIKTNSQFWRVMLMFSFAGSSCVLVRKPVFAALGINESTPSWLWWLSWALVIFPSYQVLLLVWGKIFGVFPFAWWFEKKMLRRFGLWREPETGPPTL